MMNGRLLGLVAVLATSAACAAPTSDAPSASSDSAVVQSQLAVGSVKAAIAELDALRNGDPIGTYYADGDRIEGCWRNPAGSKLTDLKKAFYCSYPLEFRLCNTVVLLTVDESDVASRYRGYLECQDKVATILGEGFHFGSKVDAVYKQLYLQGAKLSTEDTAAIVDATKPAYSERPFAVVLASIGKSLTEEAIDLGIRATLEPMADDLAHRSGVIR